MGRQDDPGCGPLRVPCISPRMASAGSCLYVLRSMAYDETRHARKGVASPITGTVGILCTGHGEGKGGDGAAGDELQVLYLTFLDHRI